MDNELVEPEEPQVVTLDINMEGNEDEAWVDVKADAEELGVQETFIDAMQHMSRWNGRWRRVGQAKTWAVQNLKSWETHFQMWKTFAVAALLSSESAKYCQNIEIEAIFPHLGKFILALETSIFKPYWCSIPWVPSGEVKYGRLFWSFSSNVC
ncbi:hypothetical protein BDW22DRAFT_1344938 [Trametopsis cervina]|nr:hypothetical protein BDW22DRAFT_1344938 [Trametopsis cervina]